MYSFGNMVVDYLRAAACKATHGKTVTFYLGGAGKPIFKQMLLDYLRGPRRRAHPTCMKNASVIPSLTTKLPRSPKGGASIILL